VRSFFGSLVMVAVATVVGFESANRASEVFPFVIESAGIGYVDECKMLASCAARGFCFPSLALFGFALSTTHFNVLS